MIEFPISGIETYWWLPLLVSFGISSLTSTGGVSGAFILLPFQISVLGFTGPAVSATNLLFNIVATPSGVYRYSREKRMVWPLARAIVVATIPGLFLGVIVRIKYLPNPGTFKLFAACVLAYLAYRLLKDVIRPAVQPDTKSARSSEFSVHDAKMSIREVSYEFNGVAYSVATWKLFVLSFAVGTVGGIYGIGGGAILIPFLVSVFRLPIHSVAGTCLLTTFVTSVVGVLFYTALAPLFADTGLSISPDWLLGIMFGVGGSAGMYLGARIQRFIPPRLIKGMLTAILLFIVAKYVVAFLG